jgi:HPt (histidine-containing phosphotransfer) domain-containing protein
MERLKSIGGGDSAFVAELIDTFLKESPQLMAQLRDAAAGGDVESLRRSAHTLKSNSAEFGASALSALCRGIEDMAKNRSLQGVLDRVSEAEKEYQRARSALETLRRTL